VDGTDIDSMLDLAIIIRDNEPGIVLTLTILRDGKEISIDVTLGERLDVTPGERGE
jgi:S1-C subfamily serine protease